MSANLEQSQPQVIPPRTSALIDHQSVNYAPLKALLQRQNGNPKSESTLQAALKERFRHHMNQEKHIWTSMYSVGYEVANFIEGRQFLTPNRFIPGAWLPYTPRNPNESTRRTLNLMRFYATNAIQKWQSSNPDIVARAGIDTDAAYESASAADLIVEHYERKFFGPFITIQEGLQALCWGTYIWDIFYDPSKHSMMVQQPVMGDVPVTAGEGYGTCGDCGFEGTALHFPNPAGPLSPCPDCGGTAAVEPPVTGTAPGVVGSRNVQLGDLRASLLPFPECRWDLRMRAEESSWFIHQRRTSLTAIRRLIGNIRVAYAGTGTNDIGLDIVERLAWAGQSGGGTASAENRRPKLYEEPCVVVEYSLSPDDIADIRIERDEETVGGQIIRAGSLLNTFPSGLIAQGLNGFELLTGVFAEHHSQRIVTGNWHSRALSGAGQGFTDLVEVQKRFNADDSQVHTFMRANGTPAMLVRTEALGDENRLDYLGTPNINIPIISQNLPDDMRLDDIVRPAFQPQSVPAQMFNYVYERLNDFAQLTSHITQFASGLPGVNNKTATGANITQSNSNALFTPPLQIKGEVRKRIAEIVTELYRRHFPVDRYFPFKGKYGRQQGKYISGANLSTDIVFEVTLDSELPRDQYTKREEYTGFFGLFQGGFVGYMQARTEMPELMLEMERAFNINIKSETFNIVGTLCNQRIQQMKAVQELVPDPEILLTVIDPPIAEREPSHDVKAKWLQDWLDTDDGQEAGPVLRMSVQLLIDEHFSLHGQQQAAIMGQQGMIQGTGEGAAQLPSAVGQHVLDLHAQQQEAANAPPDQQQHPMAKVIESIAFKDLPPNAQNALLKQVDLPGGIEELRKVHAATIAKAKAAKPAAKPKPKR